MKELESDLKYTSAHLVNEFGLKKVADLNLSCRFYLKPVYMQRKEFCTPNVFSLFDVR